MRKPEDGKDVDGRGLQAINILGMDVLERVSDTKNFQS
jgi:hypothetical protein